MLRRDSIWFGILLGAILPAVFYVLLLLIGRLTEPGTFIARPFQGYKPILLSLIVNLILIRVYFVNFKMDKTGRGILMATFIMVFVFFTFFKHI